MRSAWKNWLWLATFLSYCSLGFIPYSGTANKSYTNVAIAGSCLLPVSHGAIAGYYCYLLVMWWRHPIWFWEEVRKDSLDTGQHSDIQGILSFCSGSKWAYCPDFEFLCKTVGNVWTCSTAMYCTSFLPWVVKGQLIIGLYYQLWCWNSTRLYNFTLTSENRGLD